MKKIFWFSFWWLTLGTFTQAAYWFLTDALLQEKTKVYLTQLSSDGVDVLLQELTLSNLYSFGASTYIVVGLAIISYLVIELFQKRIIS